MIRSALAVFVFVSMFIVACDTTDRSALDASQAKLMVSYLDNVRTGRETESLVQDLMANEGTALIVEQMNLVRLVNTDQYRTLLESFAAGDQPDIAPLDGTERAERGVMGLERDVWRALSWGRENVESLREQLTSIAQRDVYADARALALSFLPQSVDIHPRLYVVAGGRAGAAALSGDRIYMDILVMTGMRASSGEPLMTEQEVVDYFAHEMHHIGLSALLDTPGNPRHDTTYLSVFLRGIVTEGAPTYLINAHRDRSKLQSTVMVGDTPMSMNDALSWTQNMLNRIRDHEFKDRDAYEKANLLLLGLASHNLGAYMLGIIDRADGIGAVMAVLSNPLSLPARFNEAVEKLTSLDPSFNVTTFDHELALSVSHEAGE